MFWLGGALRGWDALIVQKLKSRTFQNLKWGYYYEGVWMAHNFKMFFLCSGFADDIIISMDISIFWKMFPQSRMVVSSRIFEKSNIGMAQLSGFSFNSLIYFWIFLVHNCSNLLHLIWLSNIATGITSCYYWFHISYKQESSPDLFKPREFLHRDPSRFPTASNFTTPLHSHTRFCVFAVLHYLSYAVVICY